MPAMQHALRCGVCVWPGRTQKIWAVGSNPCVPHGFMRGPTGLSCGSVCAQGQSLCLPLASPQPASWPEAASHVPSISPATLTITQVGAP